MTETVAANLDARGQQLIDGVEIKELVTHPDERGFFREMIRVTDSFFDVVVTRTSVRPHAYKLSLGDHSRVEVI
jgi:dTDP-4-dehydrorhamnose 3,5-epimerase-like enzyme